MDDLLDRLPCGYLAFGDDGVITRANPELLAMVERAHDEVVGHHVERLLTVGSRIFYQTHWFPLLRLHGRAEEIFMLLRSSAGEEVGVLVNAARQEDPSVYVCIVVRVRERARYEEQLLRARRAAEETSAKLEEQKREMERANYLLETQAVELEVQHEELEGAARRLEAINAELLARTEEAEQLRQAAEEANHAKSNFLTVMSHELRTPLNAIAGYVDLLKMGISGPLTEMQRDMLERIGRSERHLLGLINEVLNLARIESGRVDYSRESVPLQDVVDGVSPMVEPQLSAKQIEYSSSVPPELVACADPDKAQQVLLNLLSNAAKFTPPGGRVTVSGGREEDGEERVYLRVTDTGMGIPADQLEDVFQPFVQVDASRTRAAEGSGLGLAISRDLARGMGGDLTVLSKVPGGSTFTLWLPPVASPVPADRTS